MSRYSITLHMDHKECFNTQHGHICPMATKLPTGVYCGARNCMGQKEDLMKSCPIDEKPSQPTKYITCSNCGTPYHDHLVECPECGFIE